MQRILVLTLLLFTASGCANQYVFEEDSVKTQGDGIFQKKEMDPKLDPYNEL